MSGPTVGVSSTNPKTMPADHAALPVWNAENWFYEDFVVGQKIRSLRRTISEGESMAFNALVLDMHSYVADQMFATREGVFGKRLVAGAFVFSAGLGLVATNCVNAFSYGYDKLRFIKPTFIGDTIYSIRTNLDKRPKYKDLGLIRALSLRKPAELSAVAEAWRPWRAYAALHLWNSLNAGG